MDPTGTEPIGHDSQKNARNMASWVTLWFTANTHACGRHGTISLLAPSKKRFARPGDISPSFFCHGLPRFELHWNFMTDAVDQSDPVSRLRMTRAARHVEAGVSKGNGSPSGSCLLDARMFVSFANSHRHFDS